MDKELQLFSNDLTVLYVVVHPGKEKWTQQSKFFPALQCQALPSITTLAPALAPQRGLIVVVGVDQSAGQRVNLTRRADSLDTRPGCLSVRLLACTVLSWDTFQTAL